MLTTISPLTAAVSGLVAAAAKTSTKSSGSAVLDFYLLIVIAFGAYYMLVVRPRKMKLRQQQAQQREFEVGTEVLTAGGLVGTVIAIDDDRITLETSVGASFVVLRPYILRRTDVDLAAPMAATGLAGLLAGGRQAHPREVDVDGEADDDADGEPGGEYDEEHEGQGGVDDHEHLGHDDGAGEGQ